jgi:hypothetical protein
MNPGSCLNDEMVEFAVCIHCRRRIERFAPNCVVEIDNYGGGSVMVWGAISYAVSANSW